MRRDLIYFRKSVWSLRDGINSLLRDETPLISNEVKVFLRDVYDHVVQVIDSIENQREMVYSLYDMYMSALSNRMNEVMKVLTIIATIFIPLTFIAGIYGMNFNPEASRWNMPELSWPWGYPAVMVLMLILGLLMVVYFKKKRWL
ncbi:magnesium and cobalt transport protein CorA [Geofilum rubicundum JCM 15548]|uniref:Magnesium transport protein CorA n=1 Tax=Geofilum rubicundum JCM 15548 TaxID=1236989 RepID=A0A0E9LYP5_9BACT|nr:magnesium and cobalt transport protein CorA [Geofilum rubicundum JCM 15548]